MKIVLIQDMKSCISQGQKTIPAGTEMIKYFSQLSWNYFKDSLGNKLIIMGFDSDDWSNVQIIK